MTMNGSNLPPGVSVFNSNVNPGDDAWDKLFEEMTATAERENMTDMDVFLAWRLGLSALKTARQLGGKFPSD